MKKDFIICICAIVIGVCAWFGSSFWDRYQALKFKHEQAVLAAQAEQQLAAEKTKVIVAQQEKNQQKAKAEVQQHRQTLIEDRGKVEAEVARCKLTSIMLGPPDIAIIDKHPYEPRSELALPSGRKLLVASIAADAVTLSDGVQNYRLPLPSASELRAK